MQKKKLEKFENATKGFQSKILKQPTSISDSDFTAPSLTSPCSATNVWRSTKSATCDDSDEDCFLLDLKKAVANNHDKCRFADQQQRPLNICAE